MTELGKNKVSISHIGDLTLILPEGEFLVENDADYMRACQKLSAYSDFHGYQNMWVRSKNHFSWLQDFTVQIGCPAIFIEKTPRLVLAEKWNTDLPDWISDDVIRDHRLLELELAYHKPMRFEARFLSHFLGTAFSNETLASPEIVSVVKSLVSDEAKAAFKENPLLSRCLESQCRLWADHSSEVWIREVCNRLSGDYTRLWHWLSLWSCLHGYPVKLLEFVMPPEQASFVRKVPPDPIRDLPLEPAAREQILTQVELFFTEVKGQINSSNEFRKVAGWTSGQLIQEFQFISSVLKSGQFSPTDADIQAVREKFEFCPGVSENHLNSLIYCVKPGRPALLGPDEEWNCEQWLRWTTEEYMPYRTWQIHNAYYDEDLGKTVARFSDWYMSEYASIHKDPDLSLAHCLTNIFSEGSENEFTIILLLDCLPISFMRIMDDALRNTGLSRHGLNYRFAGLPTITENNKIALLSGGWQEKGGNYEAVLKKRSAYDWSGKNVVYITSLKAMLEMATPKKGSIAVLNFLDGDELLHSDVESKITTYEEELHRLFTRVAEVVNRLSLEWEGLKDHFNVYVATDHGACRILEQEKRSFDSEVINKMFSNEKHRFSVLSEEEAHELPQNLLEIGHRFKNPFSSENKIYFLPRGHNTVRHAGYAKGYMHGGATPEEVIVPAAFYKLLKAGWQKPAARFLKLDLAKATDKAKFYIQRIVPLEIEVQNPNTVEMRILRATVISPEADLKSCETITIPGGSARPMIMNCYFKKTAIGERPLEIEIAYEIAGEHLTVSLALESEFRSATSGGFNLRDI